MLSKSKQIHTKVSRWAFVVNTILNMFPCWMTLQGFASTLKETKQGITRYLPLRLRMGPDPVPTMNRPQSVLCSLLQHLYAHTLSTPPLHGISSHMRQHTAAHTCDGQACKCQRDRRQQTFPQPSTQVAQKAWSILGETQGEQRVAPHQLSAPANWQRCTKSMDVKHLRNSHCSWKRPQIYCDNKGGTPEHLQTSVPCLVSHHCHVQSYSRCETCSLCLWSLWRCGEGAGAPWQTLIATALAQRWSNSDMQSLDYLMRCAACCFSRPWSSRSEKWQIK